MILKDIKKLDVAYIPDRILCREKEINFLRLHMKNGRAIISGGVGTGKTLLAKHYGGDAYVNCYMNRTEHRVVEEIVRQLKPNFHTAGMTTQALWAEVEGSKVIILDEIDGMLPEELRHFAYTMSRMKEKGKEVNYIAITRSANILRQVIGDDATWSTFADKAIVQLSHYKWEEIMKILDYRAGEALKKDAYDEEILSLIADIAINSPGHMRAAIDVLRNAALIAENEGSDEIKAEHVRMANEEGWLSDVESLEGEEAIILLSIANACKEKAYVSMEEINDMVKMKSEEHGIKIKNVEEVLNRLIKEDFVYKGNKGYTILNYPCNEIIKRLEK
ncbi:MAG: AAA family ATPase [Thermoplasmata archaeon]|nr:MAG: AAA family ATPase [Thermoplasmata archaeon]